jgi:hypothetical protein
MSNETVKQASRRDFTPSDSLTWEMLQTGSLQRIADATEAMAKNHIQLQQERERYKRWYDDERYERAKLEKSNAALRGQITKLRKKLKS